MMGKAKNRPVVKPQEPKRVLLAVMNNRLEVPVYFMKSVMEIIAHSKIFKVDVELRFFNAVDINVMRNMAVKHAIDLKFDYIMQLDTDMSYPFNTIKKLLRRDKDVVMGTARRRWPPFSYVHCKKLNYKFHDEKNIIDPKGKDLIQVEVSGVPGALIKTSVFKKMKYPYFLVKYRKNDIVGGDITFCKKCKELGIPIWIDPTLHYGHKIDFLISKEGMKPV